MSTSDSKPPFVSNIPSPLMGVLTDKEVWLYENVSILGQKTEYLLNKQEQHGEELEKQNKELSEIKKQTTATNGKVAKAMVDIAEMQQQHTDEESLKRDVQKLVDTKKTLSNLLVNKWFYIGTGFLVTGIITVAKNPTLVEWLKIFF